MGIHWDGKNVSNFLVSEPGDLKTSLDTTLRSDLLHASAKRQLGPYPQAAFKPVPEVLSAATDSSKASSEAAARQSDYSAPAPSRSLTFDSELRQPFCAYVLPELGAVRLVTLRVTCRYFCFQCSHRPHNKHLLGSVLSIVTTCHKRLC